MARYVSNLRRVRRPVTGIDEQDMNEADGTEIEPINAQVARKRPGPALISGRVPGAAA